MTRKVYLNHDGGVDDLVSLYLLLKMDDVEVVGVGVIEADCYLEPAVSASKKIIEKFGSEKDKKHIKVASSNSRPVHPFPKEWRMHAFTVDALPILNEHKPVSIQDSSLKAHEDLVHVLKNSDEKIDLVFVGPLTDLARALEMDASIEEKINKLYWMGGTFLEHGNIEEPEHDGTAEWNVFWDPFAAKRVWDSSIKIELVALESTRKVPLTLDVRDMWASQRRFEGVDFLGQCYAIVPPLTHFVTNSTYFLWDVLTTASFGQEALVKRDIVYSDVVTTGASKGRTIKVENGRPVDLVYDVNPTAFFDYITDLAKK
ncbi:nucleoside hydrolase [Carnobacteriaceae bacterium zg-84]|uniref:nucleoside hydrolase n=1 Tax=Granulicatella sp. zg-84 TaxID=2678503 RepID=UPI0013C20EAE|nr:nucleoside hydrolase [Granulicatella sp. zg-84]NEW65398.1 ABC transporter substrate-binding protein [Granulicatella sp. zg-84]NEW66865.1 ABC transporter substrate-binding protein [Granulicatella sp. zg-84]QMI85092.1 nucleoside hydrolase [Carnobacteriaceae bacterium zg-84]QMI85110.1 nucleoside hydrolase [Carnobacteriaceae bacterium zg-84]